MAFYGDYFVFDGTPCITFGLRLYEIGSTSPDQGKFSSPDVSEERIAGRYKTFYYGTQHNEPLVFKMVFGVDEGLASDEYYIDRWDREAISAWLSPMDGYKWLEICQDDMEYVRYRCRIEKLEMIEINNLPMAFSCEVHCDSPFGYMYETIYSYECQTGTDRNAHTDIEFRNLSSFRGYYAPKLVITMKNDNYIKIKNLSDGGRELEFKQLPSRNLVITIDNENGVITSSDGLNLYKYFNFNFFRLAYGTNSLEVTGNCTLKFICEFPINMGG